MSKMELSPSKMSSQEEKKTDESSSEDEDFLEIATDKDFLALTPGDANV